MTSGNNLRIFGTTLGRFGRLLFFLFNQRFHRFSALWIIKLMNILNHRMTMAGKFNGHISCTTRVQTHASGIWLHESRHQQSLYTIRHHNNRTPMA
jgi:hypothetical protein